MAFLIFGALSNLVGLVLVLGAGHIHVWLPKWWRRDPRGDDGFEGSWSIAAGGFLIIVGSAIMTYELINRFD